MTGTPAPAPLTPAQAQRRFVALTALRWLPIGIAVPVTVLLASARGLSPADIGVTMAVYGLVTLLLELPTGGLADAIGHRPVLILSGALTIAGLLTMVVADNVLLFAVAWGLKGAGRALDSGPLEAWYIDAVHVTEPGADTTQGLSRAGAADGLGLSLGAILGGVIPLLVDDGGSAALAMPLVLAAALVVVSLVGVVLLVTPLRTSPVSGARALAAGVRQIPVVVRDTARMVSRDRLLRLLLGLSFLLGVVLTILELLGPLQFADLTGSRTEGSAVFGVVMAVSFAAAALGSLLAPTARRSARGSIAWASAGTLVLAALTVAGIAVVGHVVLAGLAFALFYLFEGMGWPLRQQMLHEQTGSAQRATTVSANSLALMLGGMLGSLLLPRLAEAAGMTVTFLAGAAGLLLMAVVSLGLRPRRDTDVEEPVGQASNAVG